MRSFRRWCVVSVALVAVSISGAHAQSPEKKPEAPAAPKGPDKKPEDNRGYPHLELEHKAAASEVMLKARKFLDDAKCDVCSGTGMVKKEWMEYPKSNPNSNVPLKEGRKRTKQEKCDKCQGSGLSHAKSFEVAVDNLAKAA